MLIILFSFNFVIIEVFIPAVVVNVPIIFNLIIMFVKTFICWDHKVMRLMKVKLIFNIALHHLNRVMYMRAVIR